MICTKRTVGQSHTNDSGRYRGAQNHREEQISRVERTTIRHSTKMSRCYFAIPAKPILQ